MREAEAGPLTLSERNDLDLIRARIAVSRIDFEERRVTETNPVLYPQEALDGVFFLVGRDFAPMEERFPSVLARLLAIPEVLEAGRRNLTHPSRTHTEIALSYAESGIEFLEETMGILAEALPGRVAGAREAAEGAREAFVGFARFLREELLPRSTGSFALGARLFDRKLAEEHYLPYDCAGLEALGRKALRDIRAQFDALATEIGRGRTPAEIIEDVKRRHPPAERVRETYVEWMEKARDFVRARNLMPFPPGEEILVIDTPVFERATIPYAAYLPPGPFDRSQKGLFYVTPVDAGASATVRAEQLLGHNFAGIVVTSLHEAYPGHHLQCCHANRAPSPIRKTADSNVFAEGWALYCEEMMFEEGFYEEKEVRLFQLKEAIWRATRVVVDVQLHTGAIDFREAVRMLVRDGLLEESNAEAEVRRYTLSPTQPMSYMTGRLEIQRLRAEVKETLGAAFRLHDFHAALLATGTVPLRIARDEVLDALTPGGRSRGAA
jgi:uncharacterized protein (DUF885 family)